MMVLKLKNKEHAVHHRRTSRSHAENSNIQLFSHNLTSSASQRKNKCTLYVSERGKKKSVRIPKTFGFSQMFVHSSVFKPASRHWRNTHGVCVVRGQENNQCQGGVMKPSFCYLPEADYSAYALFLLHYRGLSRNHFYLLKSDTGHTLEPVLRSVLKFQL